MGLGGRRCPCHGHAASGRAVYHRATSASRNRGGVVRSGQGGRLRAVASHGEKGLHTCTGVESSSPPRSRPRSAALLPKHATVVARLPRAPAPPWGRRIPHLYTCGILVSPAISPEERRLAAQACDGRGKAPSSARSAMGKEDSTPVQVWNPRLPRDLARGAPPRCPSMRRWSPSSLERPRRHGEGGFHTCTGVESSSPPRSRPRSAALLPKHATVVARLPRAPAPPWGRRIPHLYRCGILVSPAISPEKRRLAAQACDGGRQAPSSARAAMGKEDSTPVQVWNRRRRHTQFGGRCLKGTTPIAASRNQRGQTAAENRPRPRPRLSCSGIPCRKTRFCGFVAQIVTTL